MSETERNIKRHFKSGKSLTSLQALRQYGTIRLPEYVRRLRVAGMSIKMTRVQAKNKWFGRYKMA